MCFILGIREVPLRPGARVYRGPFAGFAHGPHRALALASRAAPAGEMSMVTVSSGNHTHAKV